jgi:hypothetical protein
MDSSSSDSSSSSYDEEAEAINYRFSGYQLPKIILDETGPAYVQIDPHPYYRNQPAYWQKNAFRGSTLGTTEIIGGDIKIEKSGNTYPSNEGSIGPIDLLDF